MVFRKLPRHVFLRKPTLFFIDGKTVHSNLILFLTLAPVLFAQQTSQQVSPPAMSESYNPMAWKGEDADFALDTLQRNFCDAQLGKFVAAKSSTPDIQTLAHDAAEVQTRIYRKLRSLAKAFNIWLPPEHELSKCEQLEREHILSGNELDKAYLSSFRQTNAQRVVRLQAEIARPERPDNSPLRKLAENFLPTLQTLQTKADALTHLSGR